MPAHSICKSTCELCVVHCACEGHRGQLGVIQGSCEGDVGVREDRYLDRMRVHSVCVQQAGLLQEVTLRLAWYCTP